jgi:hypothetical protein
MYAQTSIHGDTITMDANGSTLPHDPDGSGPILKHDFVCSGENQPLCLTLRKLYNEAPPKWED